MEEGRDAFKIVIDKPTERRHRHTWEGNIRMDLKLIGAVVSGGIVSTQDSAYCRITIK